jgi:uncharacterized protein YegL
MTKQKTIYHFILDQSGSMSDCIDATLSGLQEQRDNIIRIAKEYPEQEIRVGLTVFNQDVQIIYQNMPTENFPSVQQLEYRPSGSTALLDAIGLSITQVENQISRDGDTAIIVILTDGYENASRFYSLIQIKNLIKSKEDSGKFTFSFLGATLDAVDIAEQMNIRRDNSAYFEKSMMKDAVFNKVSNSINDYMDRKRKGENLSKF